MPAPHAYGISTSLFQMQRLAREHLRDVAAAGFTTIELAATLTHFDYRNERNVADLQQWLGASGLTLSSVHAPVSEGLAGGRPTQPLWLASADADHRARALAHAEQALYIARRIPFRALIVHVGSAKGADGAARSSRDGARRSIEALHAAATPLGVKVAIEVAANESSSPSSLVHFIEDVLETGDVGVCLDCGHAHMTGDLIDAIETVSEHLVAVDLHDNRGRSDDHLIPFEGTIDWAAALTTVQKVGYDGPLMFELHGRGPVSDILTRARQARQRMDRLLAD